MCIGSGLAGSRRSRGVRRTCPPGAARPPLGDLCVLGPPSAHSGLKRADLRAAQVWRRCAIRRGSCERAAPLDLFCHVPAAAPSVLLGARSGAVGVGRVHGVAVLWRGARRGGPPAQSLALALCSHVEGVMEHLYPGSAGV